MKQAFIIMQIGNPELDEVCEKVIVPMLKNCGFEPKRVDKHTEGRLLKTEIVDFIITSDIIVADLTNERPNCYLEIGYAMGLDKFRNLILTAREDHNPDSPNYKKGGPKVHFDLSGYDILFWEPNNLDKFKSELEKRIKRRMATIPSLNSPWDKEWIKRNRKVALKGLKRHNFTGYMTFRDIKPNFNSSDLKEAAYKAQIKTFGWPLGAMDNFNPDFIPKPTTEGIVQNLDLENVDYYDYWTLRKDGTFYLLKNLFEDKEKPGFIFFNTRIVRITEVLLYAIRLYSGLKVPLESYLAIKIRHGGLKGRQIGATRSRRLFHKGTSIEDEIETEVGTKLEEIEINLTDLVEKFSTPLFELFNFFKIERNVLEEIVNNFVDGKVT